MCSRSFHYSGPYDPDDPFGSPLTRTALKLAPWVVVSLLRSSSPPSPFLPYLSSDPLSPDLTVGYYFGSHYASNSSIDTFSGDLAQWSRYNALARAQGAGIGFADAVVDTSALVSLFGVVAGAADRIRRVP